MFIREQYMNERRLRDQRAYRRLQVLQDGSVTLTDLVPFVSDNIDALAKLLKAEGLPSLRWKTADLWASRRGNGKF